MVGESVGEPVEGVEGVEPSQVLDDEGDLVTSVLGFVQTVNETVEVVGGVDEESCERAFAYDDAAIEELEGTVTDSDKGSLEVGSRRFKRT